jgi:hypothetical protein
LGAEHHLVQSANAMNASLQSLAHELRIYCDSDNHDQIGVSEDT